MDGASVAVGEKLVDVKCVNRDGTAGVLRVRKIKKAENERAMAAAGLTLGDVASGHRYSRNVFRMAVRSWENIRREDGTPIATPEKPERDAVLGVLAPMDLYEAVDDETADKVASYTTGKISEEKLGN